MSTVLRVCPHTPAAILTITRQWREANCRPGTEQGWRGLRAWENLDTLRPQGEKGHLTETAPAFLVSLPLTGLGHQDQDTEQTRHPSYKQ